jgi:hypothetical protein
MTVRVADDPPQALPSRGEVVFELDDLALGQVGLGGASVASGHQLEVGAFEVRDPCQQLSHFWSFDLGPKVEPKALDELVARTVAAISSRATIRSVRQLAALVRLAATLALARHRTQKLASPDLTTPARHLAILRACLSAAIGGRLPGRRKAPSPASRHNLGIHGGDRRGTEPAFVPSLWTTTS